jgi:hypothetical protein
MALDSQLWADLVLGLCEGFPMMKTSARPNSMQAQPVMFGTNIRRN